MPTPAPDHLPGCSGPLLYGTAIAIENQYPSSPKWALERNVTPQFTTDFGRIDNLAAMWKLRPRWPSPDGYVNYGDEVLLENQFAGLQLLERYSIPAFTTDPGRVRIGAAVWKIRSYPGNQSGKVDCNSEVLLENQYPGLWLLQRNTIPDFTTDPARVSSGAARWKLRPVCGAMQVGGSWVPGQFFHSSAGVTTTIRIGVKNLNSITDTETWERSLSTSVTAGYSAFGVFAEVTVTGSFTSGGSTAVTRAFEQDWCKETTISPTVSGLLWQFTFDAWSPCGQSPVDTDSYVITERQDKPPCCPPGLFADADTPHGPCIERSLCMCDDAVCSR